MSLTITVAAARGLNDREAASAADALPSVLAGILSVAPGSSLTIVIGAELVRGGGRMAIIVDASTDSEASLEQRVAEEVTRALDIAFTVDEPAPQTDPMLVAWAVEAAPSCAVGFASGNHMSNTAELVWSPRPGFAAEFLALTGQWLALASEYPGLQLEICTDFAPGASAARAFRIQARVLALTGRVPLRACALVQRMLPGLQVASTPGTESATLVTDDAGARCLLQLPLAYPEPLPGIRMAPTRPIPAVPSCGDANPSGVRLGVATLPSGQPMEIWLEEQELLRHIHVVGKTGTGKSSTLAAIMHGFAEAGDGFLLVDPHGDLCQRVMAELPEKARDRVWMIQAGDLQNPVPINPLAVDDDVQLDIVVQDMILIFYKLFDPARTGIVGPRFEALLTNALRGLRELRGTRASLLDVPRVYRDPRIEHAVAAAVTEQQLVEFWRKEMRNMNENTRSEITGWFTSKFDRFANTGAMRAILGTGADAFDPAQAMDDGRIILLDLSKGQLGEVASNLLGFLYLTRFWSGILTRKSRKPFGIIVDEAQSFSAGSLPALLSEGRKWGASVTVAHQYLAQLEPSLAESLSGNVATTIAFRTGPRDAAELTIRMGDGLHIEALTTQPDLHAVVSRTTGSVLPRPHTLIIDHNDTVVARVGADLDGFTTAIREQTYRDLVDPHRGLSPFRMDTEPNRLSTRPPTPPSFLDDWLDRRAKALVGFNGQVSDAAEDTVTEEAN